MFTALKIPVFLILLISVSPAIAALPLGLPPAAEDPIMSNIAPEKVVAYFTWAASKKADPNSKNKTEQLLADQEIQTLIKNIDKVIIASINNEFGRNKEMQEAALAATELVKIVLSNSGAIYFGNSKVIDAGLVSNLGKQSAAVKKQIKVFEDLLGQQLEEVTIAGQKWKVLTSPNENLNLVWGFKGDYLLFGTQVASIEGILKRWDTKPPKWLTAIRKRMPVGKTSAILYINVEEGKKMISKFNDGGLSSIGDPELLIIGAIIGANDIKSISSVFGFDEKGYVSRTLLTFKEKPTGIFNLLNGKPLSLKDLSSIPKDSTFAAAARFNAADVYQKLRKMIEKVDTDALEEFDEAVEEFQTELGVDLNEDVFKALGDVWRLYNSPSDGGFVFTGLTGVVSVKDPKKIAKVLQKLESYVQKQVKEQLENEDRPRWRRNRYVTIKHFEHKGQTVYFMNSVGETIPFAPAWCVTDKEFVIALYPGHVKSYLTRLKSKNSKIASIASVPEVAQLFSGKKGPVVMSYQDSREVFKLAYPLMQFLATMACGEMQRQGIEIDMSVWPSAAPFLKHLGPEVTTLTYTDDGIELISKGTVPMNIGALPIIGAGTMFMFLVADGPVGIKAGLLSTVSAKQQRKKLMRKSRKQEYTLPRSLAN